MNASQRLPSGIQACDLMQSGTGFRKDTAAARHEQTLASRHEADIANDFAPFRSRPPPKANATVRNGLGAPLFSCQSKMAWLICS